MKKILLSAVVLAGVVGVAVVWQADATPQAHVPGPGFASLDQDRDGYVSRSEYVTARTTRTDLFQVLDLDRDGRIAPEEYRTSLKRIHGNPSAYRGEKI